MISICRQLKHWAGLAACILGSAMPATAGFPSAKTNCTGFALQLGLDTKTIQVTPEYKEAALQATLPLFSDFAQRLQLPVPHPLTRGDIVDCGLTPFQKINGEIDTIAIRTKQGFSFDFFQGNVRAFSGPDSYRAMQDIHTVSNFFGPVKITREKAIRLARDTLKKLGIPPEDLFAEQEPQVEVPTWETNTIARYLIDWRDPRGNNGPNTVRAEVNAENGRVESFRILPENGMKKPAPKVAVAVPAGHDRFDSLIPPPVSPIYAWKLIPLMLAAIDEYGQKLSLLIPRPLTTNNVARIEVHNNEGWPHAEITLTNGWRFVYRHTMVSGYYAPDNFFDSDNRKIHIRDFDGKWNLTTNQAIEIVRQALKKLDYPTNHIHMDDAKSFIYVASVNKEHIPRLSFQWYYEPNDDLQSRLEAEVNADTGKLESLYYDDKAYWDSRPPIDVPISAGK